MSDIEALAKVIRESSSLAGTPGERRLAAMVFELACVLRDHLAEAAKEKCHRIDRTLP